MMEKEKNLTQAEEAEAAAVEARKKQEMEDNPFLVFFKKPFTFEGVSYESVDLSGLESLSAADMIAVNKTIERIDPVHRKRQRRDGFQAYADRSPREK